MAKNNLIPISELHKDYLLYCNQGMKHFELNTAAYHEVSRSGAIYAIKNAQSGKQQTVPGSTMVLLVYH